MAGALPAVVATELDEATTPGDQPWCLVTALASSTWETLAGRAALAAATIVFPPKVGQHQQHDPRAPPAPRARRRPCARAWW